jgi:hypothetical protein
MEELKGLSPSTTPFGKRKFIKLVANNTLSKSFVNPKNELAKIIFLRIIV